MTVPPPPSRAARPVRALVVGTVALLAALVLRPFLVPVLWAAILAWTVWPLHDRLQRALGGRPQASAVLLTLALSAAVVLPLLWLLAVLQSELVAAYGSVSAWLAAGPHALPAPLARLPGMGEWLQHGLDDLARDPQSLRTQLGAWVQRQSGALLDLLGGASRNALKLGIALIALLFLLRDGPSLHAQLRLAGRRVMGERVDDYLQAVGDTTRSIVHGLVLSALAQGALAGLGYWAAGLSAPLLLALLTCLVALVPWGTPLVWLPVGAWLLVTGHVGAGIGLLLWGTLAVSWIDNLLRPLVISSATHVPFLVVMLGVLGGAAAFGLIGLFVGPVILATALALWREWLEQAAQEPPTA